LPAFSRMQWWQEGNRDVEEALLGLHYVALAELCVKLKACPAVFAPHIPGQVTRTFAQSPGAAWLIG
jgi:hypothetical protein